MFRAVHFGWFLAALLAGVVGCRPEEEIRRYTVPKETSRASVAKPQAAKAEPTDRMLVAVVPHGGQATFLKLVGPIAQVESVADDVKKFVESLEVAGDQPPEWRLPEGWREQAGDGFRRATLLVPAGDTTLELAISELRWQASDSYLLENVNRWRGQMELPPLEPTQLKEAIETFAVGDTQATWLDMAGRSTGSMAPFASGRAAVAKPQAAERLPFDQAPPPEWTAKPASGIRRAEFQVGDGPAAAVVTVFAFPTSSPPQMASPLANVDRWRQEVGLAPTNESELAKTAERMTISGKDGIFVAMESPEDREPREATLAAMATHGDLIWFFKLNGPRETVLAERERFREWLDSIRFGE